MYRKSIETNSGKDAAKIRKIFELCKSYAKIFENNLHFYGAAPVSIAGREGDEGIVESVFRKVEMIEVTLWIFYYCNAIIPKINTGKCILKPKLFEMPNLPDSKHATH